MAAKEDARDPKVDRRTVFVRNLAFSTTKAKLEEAFTQVGPVRSCFLVTDRGSEQHKGFGFVQFALAEDADRAVESKHGSSLDGRKIKVELANRRAPLEERKTKKREPGEPAPGFRKEEAPGQEAEQQRVPKAEGEVEQKEKAPKVHKDLVNHAKKKKGEKLESGEAAAEEKEKPKAVKRRAEQSAGAPAKKARQEGHVSEKQKPARTVVFGNLATPAVHKAVLGKVRSLGQVEDVRETLAQEELAGNSLQKDGCTLPAALVVFQSVRAARAAVAALHGQKVSGETVWARELGGEGAKLKKWRLIVRNLPFQVKESALRELFSKAGFVWQLTVPRKTDGKLRGFAFVEYTSKADAEKAISSLNGQKLGGRAVVVDWAVAKSQYEAHMAQAQEAGAKDEGAPEEEDSEEDGSSQDEEYDRETAKGGQEVESSAESEDESGQEANDDKGTPADESEMMQRVLQGMMQGQEDKGQPEEESGVANMDEDEDTHAARRELSKSAGPRPKENGAPAKELPQKKAPEKAERPPPVTVFVRNLPLDLDVNDLRRKLAAFGGVMSCRLVKHKLTGRTKGTAFVDFATREGAEAAVAASKAAGGVVIGGKSLVADLAVGKEEAKDMAVGLAVSVRDQDKRNLYLAEEGTIQEGTAAAAEMSKADAGRRQRLAQEKATKLRSPNFFVSPTRLAVHNVPKDMGEKQLKQLVVEAVKARATKQVPHIKQVKILREDSKGGKDSLGKSRGAGFVEFTEHQHALVALRALNNNPGPFGAEHRPIVEFAIENRLKLRQREMVQARRAKVQTDARPEDGGEPTEGGDSRGDRKRKRREEKKKLKKEEKLKGKQHGDIRSEKGGEADAVGSKPGNGKSPAIKKQKSSSANGTPAGKTQNPSRKAERGAKQKQEPGPGQQDLAKQLRLPDGELRTKGQKPLSRKERKRVQAGKPVGEDRLDKLVAEYKSKYFQDGQTAAQSKAGMAKDLSRWFE